MIRYEYLKINIYLKVIRLQIDIFVDYSKPYKSF